LKVFDPVACRIYIWYKKYLLERHLNEIIGNFMVPFLLSSKPVACSPVCNTGNRMRINGKG